MAITSKRAPYLDISRLLAAIFVVLFHISSGTNSFLNLGYLAVDYFFVLSGYVLFGKIEAIESAKQTLAFAVYRFKKFFPNTLLSLVFILVLILVTWFFGSKDAIVWQNVNLLSLVTYLTFLSVFVPAAIALNYPIWSLSSEFIVNCLAAFSNKFVRRLKHKEILYLLPSVLFICTLFFVTPSLEFLQWWIPLIRTASGFALGLLLGSLTMNSHTMSKQIYLYLAVALLMLSGSASMTAQIGSMAVVLSLARIETNSLSFRGNYLVRVSAELSFIVYMLHIPILNILDIIENKSPRLEITQLYILAPVYTLCVLSGSLVIMETRNYISKLAEWHK
jgi:peptidoglycan/LPS O-acetylase OafA/YrhL